ncbi:hypothetical protein PENTCL1PPCAC_15523, partial [Pristionchus entomophagus]
WHRTEYHLVVASMGDSDFRIEGSNVVLHRTHDHEVAFAVRLRHCDLVVKANFFIDESDFSVGKGLISFPLILTSSSLAETATEKRKRWITLE